MVSKKAIFLASFSVIFLYLGFLFSSEKEFKKIQLEEVLSIGKLDDDALFQWVGVVTDSDNFIYVTDAMDFSIKKFDERGNLLKKTGRKGQGPGEFTAIRYLGISDKFLYVTEQYRPEIQIFDKDLNYKRGVVIPFPIADLEVLSDDEIAISTIIKDQAPKILIFNAKANVKRELQYSEETSPLMMDMVNFDFGPKGNLYLASNFQDKIEKFAPDGKKLWSKGLLKVKEAKKEKLVLFTLPTEFVYKDVALDNSDNLFVLGGHYSKNPSCDVYVLSPEGKLLTTFTLPDDSHCIYIDSRGFLYSRANEGITLKKFKMKYIDG
jgi:hypothetical protein